MSNVFSIKGSSFLNNSWLAPIEKVFNRKDFKNYYEIKEDFNEAYILGPGLISGISVKITEGMVSLEIQDFASKLDWQILFSCLNSMLSAGRGLLYKNEDQYAVMNITDEEASHMYYKHMKKAIVDTRRLLIKKELEQTFLRINDFSVLLKLSDLPKSAEIDTTDWGKIEKKVSVQVETYGPIHHAKVQVIKSGNETLKVCNYHHLPSIITKQADFITLNGITRSIDGMVPIANFIEAMKNKLIDLDNCYYMPEVNLHKEEDIYNQLNDVRVAIPQEEVIEEPEEDKVNPIELKEKVTGIVSQIIKSFRAGEPESSIIFNICSNPTSQDIDKKIAHATIDLFGLIQKNEALISEPEKLISSITSEEIPKEIASMIFRAISNKIKAIKKTEQKKPKTQKVKEEGGDTLVLAAALCAAIVMLSSVFFLIF